jgi:hypothetical protein
MKRSIRYTAALAALLIAWLLWRGDRRPGPNPLPVDPVASGRESKITNRKAQIPAVDATDVAKDLNAPGGSVQADLRILAEILATFRSNFPREGNPIGNNAEITTALRGENRLHLVFIPAGHPALNAAGELCDRWGTPYFFHAASGTEMEIRSAGPDRSHHTADDIVLSP